MIHNLANGLKMWKVNGNTTTLLFILNGLDILHQERIGQVHNDGTLQDHSLAQVRTKLPNSIPINQSINPLYGRMQNVSLNKIFRTQRSLKAQFSLEKMEIEISNTVGVTEVLFSNLSIARSGFEFYNLNAEDHFQPLII